MEQNTKQEDEIDHPGYVVEDDPQEVDDPVVTRLTSFESRDRRDARRAGFFCAAPGGEVSPQQKLAKELKDLDDSRTVLLNAIRARITEVDTLANARIVRIDGLINECKGRLTALEDRGPALLTELATLATELDGLAIERKGLREELGIKRGDIVLLQINKAREEVELLLKQQEELNNLRQGMFDREHAGRRNAYAERAAYWKEIKDRALKARREVEDQARAMGFTNTSTTLGVALMTFGMLATYLAGEFFAALNLQPQWGANSLLDYFLERVVEFLDRYVSYGTVWMDLGVLLSVWTGFLIFCHLLIWGIDALLKRADPIVEDPEDKRRDPNSVAQDGLNMVEVSALGFSVKQEYSKPRRLYLLWLRSLPIVFLLGVLIILTSRTEAFQANQVRLAAQLVGSGLALVLAVFCYMLLSRLAVQGNRAVRIAQAVWIAAIGASLVWVFMVIMGPALGSATVLPALFVLTILTAALAIAMALIHGELVKAGKELEMRAALALRAETHADHPGSANLLLVNRDEVRWRFEELQATIMDTIRDRAGHVRFMFQRLIHKVMVSVGAEKSSDKKENETTESVRPGRAPGATSTGMTKAERLLFPELHVKLEDVERGIQERIARIAEVKKAHDAIRNGTDRDSNILTNRIRKLDDAVKAIRRNTWQSAQALRNNKDELKRRFSAQEQDVREGFAIGLSYWPQGGHPQNGVGTTKTLPANV